MGYADLHIHTLYSPDGIPSVPAVLKHVAEKTDLDVIAITDHNSMDGVKEALALAPAYGVEVVPGCEISTAEGHLLALWVHTLVAGGLSLAETLSRVGEQGGVCIAPHPMARGCSSLHIDAIERVLRQSDLARVLVGVEVFNGGMSPTRRNQKVVALARALPLAPVGSSDSHLLRSIGHGSVEFAGKTAAGLRVALEQRATQARAGERLDGFAMLRSWIPRYLLRALGWAPWSPNPRGPIRYAPIHQIMAYSRAI